MNGVHRLINGITQRQGDFGIRNGWRGLGDSVDIQRKALAQAIGECTLALQLVQVQLGWVQRLTIFVAVIFHQFGQRIRLRTEVTGPYLAAVTDRVVIIFGDLRFSLNFGILRIRHQLKICRRGLHALYQCNQLVVFRRA